MVFSKNNKIFFLHPFPLPTGCMYPMGGLPGRGVWWWSGCWYSCCLTWPSLHLSSPSLALKKAWETPLSGAPTTLRRAYWRSVPFLEFEEKEIHLLAGYLIACSSKSYFYHCALTWLVLLFDLKFECWKYLCLDWYLLLKFYIFPSWCI